MKPWEEVAAKIHGGYPLEVSQLAMETGPNFSLAIQTGGFP